MAFSCDMHIQKSVMINIKIKWEMGLITYKFLHQNSDFYSDVLRSTSRLIFKTFFWAQNYFYPVKTGLPGSYRLISAEESTDSWSLGYTAVAYGSTRSQHSHQWLRSTIWNITMFYNVDHPLTLRLTVLCVKEHFLLFMCIWILLVIDFNQY